MTETPRAFTVTRTLDASPAEVFRAWTDPERLQWFYHDDQPVPAEPIELDLRVGGVWRQHMVFESATVYTTGGVYREIVPDEKLVFAWGATGGWPELDPARLDDSPTVTVTFSSAEGQTEMCLRVELPATLAEDAVRDWWALGIRDGWGDAVTRLAVNLEHRRDT